ncbi:epoxide hydrolase family protein [Actinomadura harenae]|uniref:Epoxide hydrolase n=1 Tax=Actinomadura harenae TaxID=2483351 RepID=A0A3M2LZZ5_9ACTN|nr:epoxide hydrolase family protein [Actinomadura harenae]RMI42796.1 epoxide hydrolase [Actinomadura harenae]
MTTLQPVEFIIAVPDGEITDLRNRLSSTRWPRAWPDPAWTAGTDVGVLARLVDYWADGFDWRGHERRLNAEPQRIATVGSQKVHFLDVRADDPTGLPLILTNGWPSTFAEMIPLAHRLAALGHDVVVPSLPGFTFSDQPTEVPTHELWHRLMTGLGHRRYVAHGGDLGAGVTSRLGASHPEAVAGIHLMAVMAAADHGDLSAAEEAYLSGIEAWKRDGGAYQHQQQTRPLTLAYGLSDSPVGLLAWILEKYRAWSDCGGDVSSRWSDDEILVQASLYWFTNTIGTSFRPYFDHLAHPLPRPVMGDVPTAVAAFPYDIAVPPREYAERTYRVVRYTRFDRGGHFAPHEEPESLARDLHEFATTLAA